MEKKYEFRVIYLSIFFFIFSDLFYRMSTISIKVDGFYCDIRKMSSIGISAPETSTYHVDGDLQTKRYKEHVTRTVR